MDTYTFKYRDDGIILNGDPSTSDDKFVDITRVEGLSNAPYRTTEREREGADGGFIDAEFEQMRPIILEGTVYGPVDTVQQYLEDLKKNFAPSKIAQPFYFQPPGLNERVVFCKSYGFKFDWETSLRTGTTPCQIQLMAEDPTIYASTPETGFTLLPASGAGRSYGRKYPLSYTPSTSTGVNQFTGGYNTGGYTGGYGVNAAVFEIVTASGIVTINNYGNKDTSALITIAGPINNPAIVHDVSGRQLLFNISLDADQFLAIDLRNRTVMLNGTTSRRNTLVNSSRWFLLSPGNNSLRLLGSDPISGLPDPAMYVTARSAYR